MRGPFVATVSVLTQCLLSVFVVEGLATVYSIMSNHGVIAHVRLQWFDTMMAISKVAARVCWQCMLYSVSMDSFLPLHQTG
jgi:hypothetical protein